MNKFNILILSSIMILGIVSTSVATAVSSKLSDSSGRTITFVNQCPFPVWFGTISGAAKSKLSTKQHPTNLCKTSADCYQGAECMQRNPNDPTTWACFWINPQPNNGNSFELTANGGTNSVTMPFSLDNQDNASWSGAAAGRTDCVNGICKTADCGIDPDSGGCAPGKGFSQPATEAEFTFNNLTSDYYDIEMVNGVNIPVSLSPDNSGNLKISADANPYTCGSPGAVVPTTKVGACNWNFNPPSDELIRVDIGGVQCKSNTDCTAPNLCGLSYNPRNTPKMQLSCGKFLGYWSPLQICGNDKTYVGNNVNCPASLSPPEQMFTHTDLYNCPAKTIGNISYLNTCYNNQATSYCCGCVNWNEQNVPVPPPPITQACNNSNSIWINTALPNLLWLKQACPTAYTYPFDDKSSTFTCQTNTKINSVNYTITFCPGAKTGIPYRN